MCETFFIFGILFFTINRGNKTKNNFVFCLYNFNCVYINVNIKHFVFYHQPFVAKLHIRKYCNCILIYFMQFKSQLFLLSQNSLLFIHPVSCHLPPCSNSFISLIYSIIFYQNAISCHHMSVLTLFLTFIFLIATVVPSVCSKTLSLSFLTSKKGSTKVLPI